MWNRAQVAALALALLLAAAPLARSIADPATKPEEGSAGAAAEPQAKPGEPASDAKRPAGGGEQTDSETFTPSEQISLDRPVSFPVDI